MKKLLLLFLIITTLASCGSNSERRESTQEQEIVFNNPEEELRYILENEGWTIVSNSTNVYRKDLDAIVDDERLYKTEYWYTAAIYCKNLNNTTKYIIARPVYNNGEVRRNDDGSLIYKTFPIVSCDYTDKYGKQYNGYISDGGSTAYLVY